MYEYDVDTEDKDLKKVGLELMFMTPEKCSSDKGITAVELAKRVELPLEIWWIQVSAYGWGWWCLQIIVQLWRCRFWQVFSILIILHMEAKFSMSTFNIYM